MTMVILLVLETGKVASFQSENVALNVIALKRRLSNESEHMSRKLITE